jgi:aspartate carbamoyltransferase catalytic subunit
LIPNYISTLGVSVSYSLENTLKWCDAANVLRIQLERQNTRYFPSLREYATYFGVNKQVLSKVNKDLIILHPGPINRGVEITSEVADSPNAIILDQVENGVAVRMAVLYLLASKG